MSDNTFFWNRQRSITPNKDAISAEPIYDLLNGLNECKGHLAQMNTIKPNDALLRALNLVEGVLQHWNKTLNAQTEPQNEVSMKV